MQYFHSLTAPVDGGISSSLTLLNYSFPVRSSLMVYLMSSHWSSPWLWKRPPWGTPSTSFRYLISRDTHRCSSLSVSSSTTLCILVIYPSSSFLLSTHLPSVIPHSPLTLFIDLSPFNHPTFSPLLSRSLSSHFCVVIHFPFRFLFSRDIFSIPSPLSSRSPFVLSYFSLDKPPLSPCLFVGPPSIISCSPLSFTFIVIHMCSMIKHWSPSESR